MSSSFKTRFTGMMDRLVSRGWLKDYSYSEGAGSVLNWTNRGAMRALLLNHINRKYGLSNKDALFSFVMLAIQETLGTMPSANDSFQAAVFWKLCIDELSLPLDIETLVAFSNVTYMFGPEHMYDFATPRGV